MCLLITKNFLFWIFWRGKMWCFWAKKLMENWYLLITEKFLVWSFWEWEIRSLLSQKVDAKMLFTGYWEVLVLNFLVIGNTVFFESRSWWNDDIYWLMRSSSFELFGNRKYGLFLSQDVDEKMIYTWCFWAFHDIPGPGKYGFSCSV